MIRLMFGFSILWGIQALSASFLSPIGQGRPISLVELKKPTSLLLVFQENCTACRRQLADLSCLPSSVSVYLLGAFSPRAALVQEYKKMNVSYPAYFLSSAGIRDLALSSAGTPQIVIYGARKQRRWFGYQNCAILGAALEEL